MTYNAHQKRLFSEGFALDWLWPSFSIVLTYGTPQKMFILENVIFLGHRLAGCYFHQQTPESPVSQLSFLPNVESICLFSWNNYIFNSRSGGTAHRTWRCPQTFSSFFSLSPLPLASSLPTSKPESLWRGVELEVSVPSNPFASTLSLATAQSY